MVVRLVQFPEHDRLQRAMFPVSRKTASPRMLIILVRTDGEEQPSCDAIELAAVWHAYSASWPKGACRRGAVKRRQGDDAGVEVRR